MLVFYVLVEGFWSSTYYIDLAVLNEKATISVPSPNPLNPLTTIFLDSFGPIIIFYLNKIDKKT